MDAVTEFVSDVLIGAASCLAMLIVVGFVAGL